MVGMILHPSRWCMGMAPDADRATFLRIRSVGGSRTGSSGRSMPPGELRTVVRDLESL